MLVLTRKLQERIQIGADITITVLRVKGGTVRVGIEAPRDVRVVRAELPRYDGSHVPAAEAAADVSPTELADGVARVVAQAAAGGETEDAADESSDELPRVGRRFVIRQERCGYGRRAVASAVR